MIKNITQVRTETEIKTKIRSTLFQPSYFSEQKQTFTKGLTANQKKACLF